MFASSASKVVRELAALWKTCGSWLSDGPQARTSLTAWVMAVRSETLCASMSPSCCAACCSVTCAVAEGLDAREADWAGTGEPGADAAVAVLAATSRCAGLPDPLTVALTSLLLLLNGWVVRIT